MFKTFVPVDETQIERARDAADRAREIEAAELAYVSGAPFAGLGSPNSDVDLFVVGDFAAETSSQLYIGPERVDVVRIPGRWLESAVDRVGDFDTGATGSNRRGGVSLGTIDKLVRFAYSQLVADDGTLAKLRSRLVEENWANLAKWLTSIHSVQSYNSVEDAQGFLAVGQWQAAEVAARRAVLIAAESLLVRHGDVYVSSKWVWRRWQRSIGERLPSWLADDVTIGRCVPAGGDDVVRRLWLAQHLALMATVEIDHRPEFDADGTGLRRDPFAAVVATSDGLQVQRSRRKPVRISHQGALLWSLCHGRSHQEAVSATVAGLARADIACPAPEVAAYLDSLLRSGLLYDSSDEPKP